MAKKIIIDTDPGVDDVLAILMALASAEIDVSLISIVFGNTHAPVAHSNLLKIYHMLAQEIAAIPEAAARFARLQGQEKTLLSLGEDCPIDGEKAVAAYFHGMDGLSNISETHPHFTPPPMTPEDVHDHLEITQKPSKDAILDVLRSEPEQTVTIVALGPLTNLAHAYRDDPATFRRVHSVVWMGGALEHPGNTSPCSEFNCFADPYAAQQILDACKAGEFTLIMAPLDITTPHQIPFDDLILADAPSSSNSTSTSQSNGFAASAPGPIRTFVSTMLKRVRGLHVSFGLPDAMEMHDPVAVWYALSNADQRPESSAQGWTLKPRDFKVERIGELTRGMCVVDRRGTQGEQGQNRSENHDNAIKAGAKDRDGSVVTRTAKLPLVIVGTPGKEVLRKLVLGRALGQEVV